VGKPNKPVSLRNIYRSIKGLLKEKKNKTKSVFFVAKNTFVFNEGKDYIVRVQEKRHSIFKFQIS